MNKLRYTYAYSNPLDFVYSNLNLASYLKNVIKYQIQYINGIALPSINVPDLILDSIADIEGKKDINREISKQKSLKEERKDKSIMIMNKTITAYKNFNITLDNKIKVLKTPSNNHRLNQYITYKLFIMLTGEYKSYYTIYGAYSKLLLHLFKERISKSDFAIVYGLEKIFKCMELEQVVDLEAPDSTPNISLEDKFRYFNIPYTKENELAVKSMSTYYNDKSTVNTESTYLEVEDVLRFVELMTNELDAIRNLMYSNLYLETNDILNSYETTTYNRNRELSINIVSDLLQ